MSNFLPYSAYESYGEPLKNDKTSNSLNLLNYDLIYFILHEEAWSSIMNKEVVRFDAKKKRHYMKGRIVELTGMQLYASFAILDQNYFSAYHLEKKIEVKRKMLTIVPFTYIETIILKMEHLDYMG